jgi:site-specific recombinase XerD
MFNALSDFLIYCRIERRLADLTCEAYERDVRTCLEFLRSQGISALAEIRTRACVASSRRRPRTALRPRARQGQSRRCAAPPEIR